MLAIGFTQLDFRSERKRQPESKITTTVAIQHLDGVHSLSFQHINCYEFPFSSIRFRSVEIICLVHFVSCGFFYVFSCVPLNLSRKYLLPVDGMWRQRWHINNDDVLSIKKKLMMKKKTYIYAHRHTSKRASKEASNVHCTRYIDEWMNVWMNNLISPNTTFIYPSKCVIISCFCCFYCYCCFLLAGSYFRIFSLSRDLHYNVRDTHAQCTLICMLNWSKALTIASITSTLNRFGSRAKIKRSKLRHKKAWCVIK